MGECRHRPLAPRPVETDAPLRGMTGRVRRSVGPAVTVEPRLRDGGRRGLCGPSGLEGVVPDSCVDARDAMPDGGG